MAGDGQWSWRDRKRDREGRFADEDRRGRPVLADLTWGMPYDDGQDEPAPPHGTRAARELEDEFRKRLSGMTIDEDTAAWAEGRYRRLLQNATVTEGETDPATRRLMRDGMLYDPDIPASAWDAGRAGEIAAGTFDGRRVELDGRTASLVFDDIRANALQPSRELNPYAYREDDPAWIIDSNGHANPLHRRDKDGNIPVDRNGRPLPPLAVAETAVDSRTEPGLRLVPTRTPDGDLAIYAADRHGNLIPHRIDTDISAWNAAYTRAGGDGYSKPWKSRTNSIYFQADNGITLGRDTGRITGSYTQRTPFGTRRFYRYEFAEDLESPATRNSGFTRETEWERRYGVE